MTVHFIGAGPGAADLITVRGRDLLGRCGVCLHPGSLAAEQLLEYCPPGARLVEATPLTLDEIVEEFRLATEQGHDVARLHVGDLSVWSAFGEQASRLDALAIPYTVTPGVPSFAAAAAALGQELTLPEIAESVVLAGAPEGMALPARETLAAFAASGATLATHLSPQTVDRVVAELAPLYGVDCPVAVVCRAARPDQKIVGGTLSTIAAELTGASIGGDCLMLVGKVLGGRNLRNSALSEVEGHRRLSGTGA